MNKKFSPKERGVVSIFAALAIMMFFTFIAGGLIYGRYVTAKSSIERAADAAALAASTELNISTYLETGNFQFSNQAYSKATAFANNNNDFLARHNIPVSVNSINLNSATQKVYVSVSADISSVLPSIFSYFGSITAQGVAETKLDK